MGTVIARNRRLHQARHLRMRLALAFVLAWFGIQQSLNPKEWIEFIPSIVHHHSPFRATSLILLHSALLLLAAAGIVAGLYLTVACLLAVTMLTLIILVLLLDGGAAGLIVRDVGLLGLAAALALDPVRFWYLKCVLRLPWPLQLNRSAQAFPPVGSDPAGTGN